MQPKLKSTATRAAAAATGGRVQSRLNAAAVARKIGMSKYSISPYQRVTAARAALLAPTLLVDATSRRHTIATFTSNALEEYAQLCEQDRHNLYMRTRMQQGRIVYLTDGTQLNFGEA